MLVYFSKCFQAYFPFTFSYLPPQTQFRALELAVSFAPKASLIFACLLRKPLPKCFLLKRAIAIVITSFPEFLLRGA